MMTLETVPSTHTPEKEKKMSNSYTADPNSPNVLTRFLSEIEAVAILSALAESGIVGTTTGSFTTGFRTEAPGDVSVIVRHKDLPRALEILATIEEEKSEIDWSNVDVGEPEDT